MRVVIIEKRESRGWGGGFGTGSEYGGTGWDAQDSGSEHHPYDSG